MFDIQKIGKSKEVGEAPILEEAGDDMVDSDGELAIDDDDMVVNSSTKDTPLVLGLQPSVTQNVPGDGQRWRKQVDTTMRAWIMTTSCERNFSDDHYMNPPERKCESLCLAYISTNLPCYFQPRRDSAVIAARRHPSSWTCQNSGRLLLITRSLWRELNDETRENSVSHRSRCTSEHVGDV